MELNSTLWRAQQLDPQVRQRLLLIAQRFVDSLDIPVRPTDIILTGSIASYGWTPASDIDLHVVLDFSAVDDDQLLVKDYLLAKKSLWNARHHITVKGFPVELYAQDVAEPHYAAGIYSLLNDQWVKQPVAAEAVVADPAVGKKVEFLQYEIDQAIAESDVAKLDQLATTLRDMRQQALAAGGEQATGNLVFKTLRHTGYLERLTNARLDLTDKQLSLSNKESAMAQGTTKQAMDFPTHLEDDLLSGFSYQELVDTVLANEPVPDEAAVIKVFNEILQSKIADAKETFKTERALIMVEIQAYAKREQRAKTAATRDIELGDVVVEAGRMLISETKGLIGHIYSKSENPESALSPVEADAVTHAVAEAITGLTVGDPMVEASASKKTAEYQGYKNYETFSVVTTLEHDQALNNMVTAWAEELRGDVHEEVTEGVWTADEALKFKLADQIKEWVMNERPELESPLSELLGSAIDNVDWIQVATNFIER